MSSLVHKQRQQVAAENKSTEEQQKVPQQLPKKGLAKRSVSFEKLLVTAFQIRLACSKCTRDSLKLCIEMLIMRWSLIARHSIVAFLEIANAIIPKWQIRARHIIETAISQRQWRRSQQSQQDQRIKAVPVTKLDDEPIKRNVIKEVKEGEQVQANDSLSRLKASEEADVTAAGAQTQNERVMRQALTVAVTGCIVLLAVQVCLAVALLLQSLRTIPLGLVFLVTCLVYIAYLLQSICDYDRVTRTTCNYGRTKGTPPRTTAKVLLVSECSSEKNVVVKATKVIELSFIERTMSKVKLL